MLITHSVYRNVRLCCSQVVKTFDENMSRQNARKKISY